MTDDRQGQDDRLAEIRQQHARGGGALWHGECGWCLRGLVCDTAFLLNRLDALTAERAAIQAAWNRDRSLLDVAIDHHMSRWKQAEAERDDALARLAAAEAALRASQGIIHEGLHGGRPTAPEHQERCEKPACRRIRAALAGSRAQAATTRCEVCRTPYEELKGGTQGCPFAWRDQEGNLVHAARRAGGQEREGAGRDGE